MTTRRTFLKQSALAGMASTSPQVFYQSLKQNSEKIKFPICIFSKHLQFLPSYEAAAELAAEIGFDGVDLAVRPKGHVLPQNISKDLPKAVGAMKAAGLEVPMMTTGIQSIDSPHANEILALATGLGIQYYRMGYLKFDKELGVGKSLENYYSSMAELAELNESYGIHGAYQNHDGRNIGAALWDIYQLVKAQNPQWLGIQYDIRHAVVEGAKSWPIDLELVHSHIRTFVIKDFHWDQRKNGSWYVKNVPLGEGMVDFGAYFSELKRLNIQGPISYHIEYKHYEDSDSPAEKRRKTYEAMKKDLTTLRKMLIEAEMDE
ncbi:MAG: sugar phosphate isomerase/epimerase family protein [Bacteroidota bacterium]